MFTTPDAGAGLHDGTMYFESRQAAGPFIEYLFYMDWDSTSLQLIVSSSAGFFFINVAANSTHTIDLIFTAGTIAFYFDGGLQGGGGAPLTETGSPGIGMALYSQNADHGYHIQSIFLRNT